MIPYPFDSSQGEFKELVKEYTKEDLFDMYCLENEVPDVIMNYIDELELTIKKLRQNGN